MVLWKERRGKRKDGIREKNNETPEDLDRGQRLIMTTEGFDGDLRVEINLKRGENKEREDVG